MTWPRKIDKDKYKDNDNENDKDKDILRTHPKTNPGDLWPLRHLMSDEKTWPDQQKDNDNDNYKDKDKYI